MTRQPSRLSTTATGPWAAQSAYAIPAALRGPNLVAYGARAHPELANLADEIVFSFNVDTWFEGNQPPNFLSKHERVDVYVPHFLRVRVRPASAQVEPTF